jgi:ribosomal protein S12 methylthiotransferase
MARKEKIGIVTLGCSKNTVDSERLMSQLKINDFELVSDPDSADTVIINTCGFIDTAKEESVNTILEAAELKKAGKIKRVFVFGCLSQRYMIDLQKEIPEVNKFFGTEAFENIVTELGGDFKYELLGERELSSPKHYAYLKISEGCDNPCSFCAIPLMRGKHRSTPKEVLLKEASALASKGVRELIIIGQDTTDYGHDIYGKRILGELLNSLSEINGIEWIRLMYAYPSHFPVETMQAIAENPKIHNYVDMPLQHISDNVLKSMRRGISKRRTIELIDTLREKIPNLTLRTTFISGYPAETEKDFEELCKFVEQTQFGRMGIFNYSMEENTTGYSLGDPVPAELKESRNSELMEIQKGISNSLNEKLVGSKQKVLIDGIEGDHYIGRTEMDAPEVDGEVLIDKNSNVMNVGEFYEVKIYDFNDYDLFGKFA